MASIIHQKLMEMVKRNMAEGECPRGTLESNIAREFRLCRADVRRVFKEMRINVKLSSMDIASKKKKVSMTDRRIFQQSEAMAHVEGD